MNLYAGYFVPNGTDPSGTYANYMPTTSVTRYVTYVDFNTYRVLTIDTWANNHDEIVPLKRSKAWEAVKAERAGATAAESSGGAVPGTLGCFWFSEWLERFPNDWNRSPFDVIGDHLTCSRGGDNWSNCRVDWEHVWHHKPRRMSVNGPTGLGDGGGAKVPLVAKDPSWSDCGRAVAGAIVPGTAQGLLNGLNGVTDRGVDAFNLISSAGGAQDV